MSEYAIEVEGLSKQYKLGKVAKSLNEQVASWFKKKETAGSDRFLALDDVSFKVKHGEALGIVGKNGAGKSTLLKVLSRITYPTSGKITINGRLASLLEVGTGFHPELSGKENIYLNGAILGMSRLEVKMKMDEIVEFSGVEKFLNTPVKHYSSGMYVRLAFSVAAHLEPEILVIDEVLAVGDSAFQAKCIDKMTEVANAGRTVLFVSHNMQAVKNLCTKGILLEKGKVKVLGDVNEVVDGYASANLSSSENDRLLNLEGEKGEKSLVFDSISFNKKVYSTGDEFKASITLKSNQEEKFESLVFGLKIKSIYDENIIHLSNLFLNYEVNHKDDTHIYEFTIPEINLKPGIYKVSFFLRTDQTIQHALPNAKKLRIEESNIYGFGNSAMIKSVWQPEFSFRTVC